MCEYNLRVNGKTVVSIEEIRERGMEIGTLEVDLISNEENAKRLSVIEKTTSTILENYMRKMKKYLTIKPMR